MKVSECETVKVQLHVVSFTLRLFCSTEKEPSIIKSRRMRWAGHVAQMGEKRNAYRLLVGKPEEKR
jgi:hypothetical protein